MGGAVELTHDDVAQILRLLEESSVDYLEVRLGDVTLVADRSGSARPAAAGPAPPAPAPPPRPAPGAVPASQPPRTAPAAEAPPARGATVAEESGGGPDSGERDGLLEVTAPVLGVFFASPEPGAPPYVEVGTTVDPDTTMGLIEVMKMFNSVTSGVRGEVTRILVRNEEFVEYGQPLFLVRPDGTG